MYHTVYHAKIYVDRVGLRLFAGLTDSKRGYGMGRRMVGLHAVFLASALMLGGCGTGNKVVNFDIPNENVTTITFSGSYLFPKKVIVVTFSLGMSKGYRGNPVGFHEGESRHPGIL